MDSLFGNSNHNGDVGSPSSDEDELSTNGRGGAHDNQSAASGQGQVIAKQTIVAVALPGNLLPQLPKQVNFDHLKNELGSGGWYSMVLWTY